AIGDEPSFVPLHNGRKFISHYANYNTPFARQVARLQILQMRMLALSFRLQTVAFAAAVGNN
ncbi:MAG TPA: hypothetical protein VMD30_10885, partial [Tepidisphaeraceae bacterium]|nr:hypothetical protein [Tepidisphaeraceae bacterium]